MDKRALEQIVYNRLGAERWDHVDAMVAEILKWAEGDTSTSAGADQRAEDDAAFVEEQAKRFLWPEHRNDYIERLINLARRATAPAPQREDRYRAGVAEPVLKDGILDVTFDAGVHWTTANGERHYHVRERADSLSLALACIYEEVGCPTSPPPDLTTPHVPVIVDMPNGYSEFVLEDVPAYGEWLQGDIEIFVAHEDRSFVGARWPTRALAALPPVRCNDE